MPPVQSCIFLFYLQNVLLSECPGPDINVWILVKKTPTFFFSSKPILIDFCLTFQTEDSKPFPKSDYDFCIYVQHYTVWLVHEFFKIFSLFLASGFCDTI